MTTDRSSRPVAYFFAQVGGARRDVLERMPGQLPRQAAMGAVIMTTAVFAAVSATYALLIADVTDVLLIAIVFGIGWGIAILNLDRMLVMGMGKERNPKRLIMLAIPRVFLALVIGVVISTPLMLKIFEPEVDAQLQKNILTQQEELRSQLQGSTTASDLAAAKGTLNELRATINAGPTTDPAANSEVKAIQSEIDALAKTASTQKSDYEKARAAALAEEDGTGGTGVAGCAAACVAKQRVANEAQARWDATTQQIAAKEAKKQQTINALRPQLLEESKQAIADAQRDIPHVQQTVNDLQQKVDAANGTSHEVALNNTGLIARLKALSDVTASDGTTRMARLAVAALFICLELLPVIFKVLTNLGKPTAYDNAIDQIDDIETDQALADWNRTQAETQRVKDEEAEELDHAREKRNIRRQVEIAAEQDQAQHHEQTLRLVNKEVAEHQREVVSEALAEWRDAARAAAGVRMNAWRQNVVGNGPAPKHVHDPTGQPMPANGTTPPGPTVTVTSLPDPGTI
ncbi:DUF4407 domain-containing protein [Gordonia aquimaris]|uniref:DUF4407 domain-containing protein n=1 Tax=Gordonia aquimaris TaxID=2984863 RepID=A0A9X3D638_9ACTN|nr:DUF4407 domain-containing protein [Gordonia aquimaris]MCX2965402.1 DUF4407 domain-containing protein [Gordonia aquimaris]